MCNPNRFILRLINRVSSSSVVKRSTAWTIWPFISSKILSLHLQYLGNGRIINIGLQEPKAKDIGDHLVKERIADFFRQG